MILPQIHVKLINFPLIFLQESINDKRRPKEFIIELKPDGMLAMGIEPQIRKIISQIRPDRQVLMWPLKLRAISVIPFLSPKVVEMTFVTCLTSTQINLVSGFIFEIVNFWNNSKYFSDEL